MLDATAGGVVQADEQLLESARREAEEELGIAGVPFAEHGLFTLKTHIAGFGALCLAAFPTGLSRFRKMKSAKCVG
ncbi:Putative Nudix hydrolase YfcD [Salmonella enterica subsp. enterica]|uniref:Nudix hydrolase YfcD n=1 Tax=Salmonella enterica I TaxID=59201 RepID=A0A379WRN8_SALET|nr:Putative Nudix hydrolase YfcD [Salmonella enterica subsp. enterica]